MVTPVVLSGGRGTRLWPLSTSHSPKQLHRLVGAEPMLLETLKRLEGLETARPVVVCGADHADELRSLLAGRDVDVIVEPIGRSTAPALAVAALLADPDEVLLVLSADHLIGDQSALHAAVAEGVELAMAGQVVAFGIKPDRPATGFGWIRPGASLGTGTARRIDAFTEKPDPATAARHLADGLFWNGGMFCVRADGYLAELGRSRPDVLAAVRAALGVDGTIDPTRYARVPAVSIDVAVMERTTRGAMVPLDAGWSDIGSWDALWEALPKDADGNVVDGEVVVRDTTGSLVRATDRVVTVIGMTDVVVVETPEGVLVVPRREAEKVRPPRR